MISTDESPTPASSAGDVFSWEEGIGDDKKYHLVHVGPEAITWALKMKDWEQFKAMSAAASEDPASAPALLAAHEKGGSLTKEQLARVDFCDKLNQMKLVDRAGNKTKIPEGAEQANVFAAVERQLGGEASEEEADAWSVLQTPLFCAIVFGGIGALFIWLAVEADPNYEASGRRSGMKALMNTVLLWLGPIGTSLIVACFVVPPVAIGIMNLIKRPMRQIRSY